MAPATSAFEINSKITKFSANMQCCLKSKPKLAESFVFLMGNTAEGEYLDVSLQMAIDMVF